MGIFFCSSAKRAVETKDRCGREDAKALRRVGNNAIVTKRKDLMNNWPQISGTDKETKV
jgi:hypothetical protein